LHLDHAVGVVAGSREAGAVEEVHAGLGLVVVDSLGVAGAGASGSAHVGVKSEHGLATETSVFVGVGGGGNRGLAEVLDDHGGSRGSSGHDSANNKDTEPDGAEAAAVNHNVAAVLDLDSGASRAGNNDGQDSAEV